MTRLRRARGRATFEDLTPPDQTEALKFRRYTEIEAARRKGADPSACDMLQAAIYFDPTQEGGGL